METVCEHESPRSAVALSTLEEERRRMHLNVKMAAGSSSIGGEDTVGAIPPMRGVRRLKSSNPNQMTRVSVSGIAGPPPRGAVQRSASLRVAHPLATPTRSTDAAASLRGSAVARANSSRALLRASGNSGGGGVVRSRGALAPSRASSAQGLRPYGRDQIVNASIARKGSNDGLQGMQQQQRGPGGTLQRNESEMSLGEFSVGDGSLFTMDSVRLRKGQLVADHLGDGSYDEQDSFACHESVVTRDSEDCLYDVAQEAQNPVLTFSDLEALRLTNRLNVCADEGSVMSCNTMASGLTNDFTEHDYSEYACDETEYAE